MCAYVRVGCFIVYIHLCIEFVAPTSNNSLITGIKQKFKCQEFLSVVTDPRNMFCVISSHVFLYLPSVHFLTLYSQVTCITYILKTHMAVSVSSKCSLSNSLQPSDMHHLHFEDSHFLGCDAVISSTRRFEGSRCLPL